MDVYILRHGKAEDAGPGIVDADRRLTKKGREEAAAAGRWIAEQELRFDLIAASPLLRAQETAALVAEVLDIQNRLVLWNVLAPGGNTDAVCRLISKHPGISSILLVGHEPLLSSLISRIITGDENAGIVMSKGALAKIKAFSYTGHPSGELVWLITAKQMAGIM